MFVLNIKIAGLEGATSLFFNEETNASACAYAVFDADPHAMFGMKDDHGNCVYILPRNIASVHVSDVMKDITRQQDMGITQMREQAKFNSKANADPALRLMAQMQQGNVSGFRQQ